MKRERIVVIAGIALALVSLLAFSLQSTSVTIGLETDVPVQDDNQGDVGAGTEANPPASLPSAGASDLGEQGGSTGMLLIGLVGALGASMTAAGLIAMRRSQNPVR